jgi:hypothetical protein
VSTEPGFPVELCGATELHAAFREESRTSLLSASAAWQEIREAVGLFVVFSQGKPHLAIFTRPRNCETALEIVLVDVTPTPVFPWLDGSHNRVPISVEVGGSVAVLGGITTTDLAALQAHAQVNPGVSDLETLLATLGVRLHVFYMILRVCTFCCAH